MTTTTTSSPRITLPSSVPPAGPTARAALRRFREADGSSHTRALAFQTMFVLISGFIGFVGLVSVLHLSAIRGAVSDLAQKIAPGPSGKLLAEAAKQGATSGGMVMFTGLVAAIVAGTLAMAQVERSANRLMGVRDDRPGWHRLGRAFVLAISAGVLIAIGGLILGAGGSIGAGAGWHGTAGSIWAVLRWPLGIALAGVGMFLLFRTAPRERFASRRAEVIGAVVSLVLLVAFTGVLSFYFAVSGSSSKTYGPLLSIVALLVWAVLASLALHLGLAVASEVEGRGAPVRATAGQHAP
jgi:YihY family inner membrane protein